MQIVNTSSSLKQLRENISYGHQTAGQVPSPGEFGAPGHKGLDQQFWAAACSQGPCTTLWAGISKAWPIQAEFLSLSPRQEKLPQNIPETCEWDKQMCSALPTSSCTQDSVSPRNHKSNSNKTQTNIRSRMQPKEEAEVFWGIQGIDFGKSIPYKSQKDSPALQF